jgi:hypothetical protein
MEDILKAVEQFIKDKHSKKEWIAGKRFSSVRWEIILMKKNM